MDISSILTIVLGTLLLASIVWGLIWIVRQYASALYHGIRGKATEPEKKGGKKMTDEKGVVFIREPTLLFEPVESRAYPIAKGESLTKFIMEFKDRLFAIKVKEWLENETDDMKKERMVLEIAALNPLFFPKGRKASKDAGEIIKTLEGDGMHPWNVLRVPKELYHYRFNGLVDEILHHIAGYRLIGWFPWSAKVQRRKFTWTQVINEGAKTAEEGDDFVQRNAYTNFFAISKSLYGLIIKGAEDEDRVPLRVELQIEVEGINPYTSIFELNNWLASLEGFVYAIVTEIIRKNSYTDLMKADGKKDDLKEDHFISEIERAVLSLNKDIPGEVKGVGCPTKLGVLITGAQVKEIDPEDETLTEKIRLAMMQEYFAKRKAKETEINAKAQLFAALKKAKGQEAQVKALGDAALVVLGNEALPNSILAYNNKEGPAALLQLPIPAKPEKKEDE